jgi:hypothetical protein
MRREIIQDFLNVPGIVGVALMGGTSTPYFCGFERENQPGFSLPQQITIAQNIQQVLETIPEGFNSFEFQFDGYRAYLHKLNRGTTLLVLTLNHLARLTYTQAVRRLLIELQIDQSDPISEFRSLAPNLLPSQLPEPSEQPSPARAHLASEPAQPTHLPRPPQSSPLSQPQAVPRAESLTPTSSRLTQPANGTGSGHQPPSPPSSTQLPAPLPAPLPAQLSTQLPAPKPGAETHSKPAPSSQGLASARLPSLAQPATAPAPDLIAPVNQLSTDVVQPHGSGSAAPVGADLLESPEDRDPLADPERVELAEQPASLPASLKDVLAAINRLSQFTSQYLGTLVVSNYWKVSCPAEDWLSHFQIERSAQMTFAVQIPSQPLPILTPSQHQCLKKWVAAFLERCSKVMRNFSKIVRQALTPQELALLFD